MEDLYEEISESLRDWFKKSKSKGGKPGWVQVVSGKPCARQPGQKTTPKCVSSAKRASMSKKERESAQRRKRAADPGQPKKSGAAKPTYVSTDKKKKKKSKKNEDLYMSLDKIIAEELEAVLDEKKKRKKKKKKKSGKKDACYHKVKSRYKVWPSAYASGALVKCRKVGAKNWGNSKKEHIQIMIEDELIQVLAERKQKRGGKKCWDGYVRNYDVPKGAPGSCKKKGKKRIKEEEEKSDLKSKVIKALRDEGGAAGMDALKKHTEASKEEIDKVVASADNIKVHEDGDIILMDSLEEQLILKKLENFLEEALYYGLIDEEEEQELYEGKKKKACKPSKGKKFARRVKGRCVSYGQAGKAKGGGPRIKPGTGKGNAYCARSYGDMKSHGKDCSGKDRGTPLCLSRQKWKCSGKYSRKGK
jgi:hypothetical protein|tara:strand:+ start:2338 stop:3591 length:1254 start_codon:yes stop_codon:yes gene_type:complete